MTVTIDDLTPVEKTLLITLTPRAMDARAPHPLLADDLAAKVLDRIGPAGAIKISSTVKIAAPVRSKMLDQLVVQFIAAHPNAVVVELGCGLETRMHRIAPPPTVDWYDVDLPDVIALRRRLIPELDRAHLVAASLTEPHWAEGIPRERPVIAVADGVLGFLTKADNTQILATLTNHFTGGGELVFVAYSRIAAKMMGGLPVQIGELRELGIPKGYQGFGFDDPRELEQLNPRVTFVEEQLGAQAMESFNDPRARAWLNDISRTTRMIGKWFARWRAQARRGVWVLRYRF
ncbi:class I SAM-dependent methyltransferase [Mycobacterium syngnathidarum]